MPNKPELIPFYKISCSEYRGGEPTPQQVMVTRFTESSIWIFCGTSKTGQVRTQQRKRTTDYESYHPSLGDAIAANREMLSKRITAMELEIGSLERRIESARKADAKWLKQQKTGRGDFVKWNDPDQMSKNIKV